MQKNKQIKAILFLSVFGIFLLHQAFPHIHHQHDENRNSNVYFEKGHQHQHNHTHHHKHNKPNKKNSVKKDIVGLLIGMHVHGFISDEIQVIRPTDKKIRLMIIGFLQKLNLHFLNVSMKLEKIK